ncbi:emp24p/erv25p- protein [Nowakowskiella sp. JEL0407]|nr:emp24p/erv25p- protein [Nowakowskiella sp. JEL0407]
MKGLELLLVLSLLTPLHALHFYLTNNERRCFIEDLPADTTTVGHYKAEELNSQTGVWSTIPELSVELTVIQLSTNRDLVKQKGIAEGKFTFTSADAGEHQLCLNLANKHHSNGWFSGTKTRIHLDLMFGDPEHDTNLAKKDALNDISQQIRDAKNRIIGLNKDLEYHKSREALWRDASERTNTKVVNWCIAQLIIIGKRFRILI